MVRETRIIFEPEDITKLRYRCGCCEGEVSHSARSGQDVPDRCPLCQQRWLIQGNGVSEKLVQALRSYLSQNTLPMKVWFEMRDGEDG